MPDGVVQWFDAKTGEAQVVRAGHRLRALVGDIEPVARRAGAHVHFDVRRLDGEERAVHVELRPGRHVSHRHHDFGTLVGAHSFDTKGPAPMAHLHPELAGPGGLHPLQVVRSWATSVANGDVAGALSLYAPDAVVHLPEEEVHGPAAMTAWVESAPLLGCRRHAQLRAADDTVTARWEPAAGEPGLVVRSRLSHGQLSEQWVATPGAAETLVVEAAQGPVSVAVSATGDVEPKDIESAAEHVARLVSRLEQPVLFTRVKLSWKPDPARERRAAIEAMLDVSGALVRAHVAARTMPEAVDRIEHRLRDQLEHLSRHRRQIRRESGEAEPGEWRHGDLPTARPPYYDRRVEERQLVRHKTFAAEDLTPDEAVFDMEQLDYDFYLFRDLASGLDSLIARDEGGEGYRLTRLAPSDIEVGPTLCKLWVTAVEAPTLTLGEARERIDASGERYLFFTDASAGRGTVLYRRYDGHYGVITLD